MNYLKQIAKRSRRAFERTDKSYCPFGDDFGLCIIPEYIREDELYLLQNAYYDLRNNRANDIRINDGCLRLPDLHKNYIISIIKRMEKEEVVPQGWFNHQHNNMYEEGDFFRAHIDNLFIYDDIIVTLSIGSNALLRLVHAQNGEKLDSIIPHGSLYILSGPARYIYFHMILPVEAPRYSLVLRRSILNSLDGGLPININQDRNNLLHKLMPFEASEVLHTLQLKSVGSVRVPISDDYLEIPLDLKYMRKELNECKSSNINNREESLNSAEWVERLRVLNDWSLSKQLDEDEMRVKELQESGVLKHDLTWRFRQLREIYRGIEDHVTNRC